MLESDSEIDLLVLDLMLPDSLQPLDSLRAIRNAFPAVPILVISANNDPQLIKDAFKLGVAGYLPKIAPIDQFECALHKILSGQIYYPQDGFNRSSPGQLQRAEKMTGDTALPVKLDLLSRRELELLQLLCAGYSNKKIAIALQISVNTVKTHLTHAFKKLNVENRTEAAVLLDQFVKSRLDHE